MVWIAMFPTLHNCVQPCTTIKRRERRLACTHTQCCWRPHQIRPRQTTFYGLATRTVHAIHITHQTDARAYTHTRIWILCVCKIGVRACGRVCLFPVQAQSDLSRPDLGLFLARPHGLRHLQREKENTMKTGSQFLDDRKKKVSERWLVWFCNRSDIRERPVL